MLCMWMDSNYPNARPKSTDPIYTSSQSSCNADCKRYAHELKNRNCTASTGSTKTKCEYRVKAFLYGCKSICARPT